MLRMNEPQAGKPAPHIFPCGVDMEDQGDGDLEEVCMSPVPEFRDENPRASVRPHNSGADAEGYKSVAPVNTRSQRISTHSLSNG